VGPPPAGADAILKELERQRAWLDSEGGRRVQVILEREQKRYEEWSNSETGRQMRAMVEREALRDSGRLAAVRDAAAQMCGVDSTKLDAAVKAARAIVGRELSDMHMWRPPVGSMPPERRVPEFASPRFQPSPEPPPSPRIAIYINGVPWPGPDSTKN
jgi:hypothetical protein